jgi:hypothetical protein
VSRLVAIILTASAMAGVSAIELSRIAPDRRPVAYLVIASASAGGLALLGLLRVLYDRYPAFFEANDRTVLAATTLSVGSVPFWAPLLDTYGALALVFFVGMFLIGAFVMFRKEDPAGRGRLRESGRSSSRRHS